LIVGAVALFAFAALQQIRLGALNGGQLGIVNGLPIKLHCKEKERE